MKKLLGFFLAIVVIAGIAMFCKLAVDSEPETFSGFIPIDQKPHFTWIKEENSDSYDLQASIMVLKGQDTIYANFLVGTSWGGSNCVEYRDSYPPCVDKLVYVSGIYDKKNNKYTIHLAGLLNNE